MGPGMGFAIASKFASEGFEIIQLARRESALEEYAQSLGSGVKVTSYPTDVSDFEGLAQTLDQIQDDHGEADLLVFNVSVLNEAPPSTVSMDVLVNEFKINVASALVCVQKVIPYMTARKSGKIFLTGGGLALKPYYVFVSLGMGKAAIRNLSVSLAQELKPHGIHVATVTINGMIEPGTHFDPDKIAEEYWRLYQQPAGKQEVEIIYE